MILKIKYLFSLLFVCLIISCIYSFFIKDSIYKSDMTDFKGVISKVKKYDSYTSFILKAKENIIFNYYGDLDFNDGDLVEIKGSIKEFANSTIPNQFDYKNYYKSLNIYYKGTVKSIKKTGVKVSVNYYIQKQINKTNKLRPYLEYFILKNNINMNDNVKESYISNNLTHLFSFSGAHLSMLLVHFSNGFVILFLLTTLFLIFNDSVSFLRAFFLFILIKINKKYNLHVDTKIINLISILVLLIINPLFIFQIAFWYSCVITTVILYFDDIKKANYFYRIIFLSLVSFIASIPINIYYFYTINYFCIITNFVFIIIYSVFIFPLLILTFIFPFIDDFAYYFILIFENLSLIFFNINKFVIVVGKINIFLFLILLFSTLITLSFLKKKRYLVLVLILIPVLFSFTNKNTEEIYFLDVGQGDSIYIQSDNKNMLIDTGNKNGTSIINFIKSKGFSTLDYLILSHGDSDHLENAIEIMENIKVKNIIINNNKINDKEKSIIKFAELMNINVTMCKRDDVINLKNMNLISINDYDGKNENDSSCVYYLISNKYNILLTGDISSTLENKIVKNYNLKVDILKVSHHGSKTSSSLFFLKSLNIKEAIISVGYNNIYKHPDESVISNFNKLNICVHKTSEEGTIYYNLK